MGFDFTLDLNKDKTFQRLGIEPNGSVQRVIDQEFIRICDPYVPMDTGLLKDSVMLNTVIGSGEVVYRAENKARRLYYGEMDWNWGNGGVQIGGLRGPYWTERAMEQGGREKVINAAKEAVQK